jgi:D-alanine-D-alanine ligase
MNKHVAVIAVSSDDTSLLTSSLIAAGYRVSQIAADANLVAALQAGGFDIVFNAADGSGRLQGLLELLAIPYTHSGVLASALATDRHQAKIVLRAASVPVTDHLIVGRAEAARHHQMSPPYVVKPIAAGTGIAPFAVLGEREAPPLHLVDADWRGGEEVMIERYAPGRTLEVVVMGDVALAVSEALSVGSGESGDAVKIQLVTPAQISPNIYEKLQKIALRAHEVLGCRSVTRVSFRYDSRASGDSGVVCLGVDALPSLKPEAPLPEQARYAGHSFADLVAWMVEDASCNR